MFAGNACLYDVAVIQEPFLICSCTTHLVKKSFGNTAWWSCYNMITAVLIKPNYNCVCIIFQF